MIDEDDSLGTAIYFASIRHTFAQLYTVVADLGNFGENTEKTGMLQQRVVYDIQFFYVGS